MSRLRPCLNRKDHETREYGFPRLLWVSLLLFMSFVGIPNVSRILQQGAPEAAIAIRNWQESTQFSGTATSRANKKQLSRLLLLVSTCIPRLCFELWGTFIGQDVFVLAPTGMGKVCIGSFARCAALIVDRVCASSYRQSWQKLVSPLLFLHCVVSIGNLPGVDSGADYYL